MRVNKPFSYQEIQKIKEDLEEYLEDPNKYVRAFKGVTLLYDLTWKDVMYILGQMLTPNSKSRVLGKAVAYGDECFSNESVGKREDEITALPTGNQVVRITEPDWDYNTAKGRWDQSHFVRCILEGLRQARAKPFSSVQFSCSVVSYSLQPHESQHARPPCPSPTPRVHSDSLSIEPVMPSSHLFLCRPLLLLPPIPPSINPHTN